MSKSTKSQNISLDENRKLQGIVIGIESNIDENDQLIKLIKERFSDASRALFEATSHMGRNEYAVQFGNISIILPEHWKLKGNYPTTQYCNNAQIKVDRNTDNGQPYFKQINGCGKSGDFVRFPVNYFLTNSHLEEKGKKIMTDFVRLRYGVYSESITSNRIYVFNGSEFISSACNKNIKIVLPKNLKVEDCIEKNKVCIHSIKENQNHNYSVMFDQFTSSSKYFCNEAEKPHNKYAKTDHNLKCRRASITSVILKHEDFKNVGNQKNKYEPPIFTIFKTGNRKIVLVLDISASMSKVINVMKKAVQIFICDIVDDNDEIGIVVFHDKASIVANLTKMDKTGRQLLNNSISKIQYQGGTNIGGGLQLGIEVLGGEIRNPEKLFGMIILLSDGENKYDPEEDDMEGETSIPYEEVLKHVKKKSVMTNVISYNQSDYLLIELSKATGGRFVHALYDVTAMQLSQRFLNVQKICPSGSPKITTIKSQNIEYKPDGKSFQFTTIDKYAGKDKMVQLTLDIKHFQYEPILTDSNGKIILFTSKILSNKKYVYTFALLDTLTGKLSLKFRRIEGRYKRSINNLSRNQSKFNKLVEENEIISSPIDGLSDTLVELLTENTTITATIDLSNYDFTDFQIFSIILEIELPNKTIKRKLMLDDGIGDDSIEGDKIFTRCLFPNELYLKGIYKLRGKLIMKNKFVSEIIRKFVDFQSIFVKDVDKSATKDRISPAQMKEPLIKTIDKQKRIIEVEMIAVGDNSMDGEISKYQIRIRWLKNKEIINKTIKAKSYEKVNFLLDLSELQINDKIIEISIRGVDNNGNIGQWSPNVAVLLSQ